MKKVLAARVTIFALACIWVIGFLSVSLAVSDTFFSVVSAYMGTAVTWLLLAWYVATVILISVLVAVKGFRFVGHWVKNDTES